MDLKIFASTVDEKAKSQIDLLVTQKAFCDCKVRIMSDVHAGAGCVIGFTANLGDKVIPNIVGVDIGCGMLTVPLDTKSVDFKDLDDCCHRNIPHGLYVHKLDKEMHYDLMESLFCYDKLHDIERLHHSIGTLGGGNHFIELDNDDAGRHYLIIHTGSRNLGKQVADLYQRMAIQYHAPNYNSDYECTRMECVKNGEGKRKIKDTMIKFTNEYFNNIGIPRDLCYLEGELRTQYLHDMAICQKFAIDNRAEIARVICNKMGWNEYFNGSDVFETVHNYIDHESNIVRKGAISAKLGERVLIPMNMSDGCIIAVGKGNADWNESAPHGAGRVLSRTQAKERLTLDEYKKRMEGIYTTCVSNKTIDESPMAYKDMSEIISNIGDTVEIQKIIKPIYNFKAE